MKKFLLISFVLVMVASLTSAQDFAKAGVLEAAGSIGFSSTTSVYDGESADDARTTFSFMPLLGYFIIDGFELGFAPRFSSSSYGDVSNSSLGIFVVPQFHFNLKSNIYPYIGAAVGYNSDSYDDGNSETDDATSSGISYGAMGGIKVQVGKAALVTIGVEYFMLNSEPEDWEGDRVGADVFSVSAGVAIFFGK